MSMITVLVAGGGAREGRWPQPVWPGGFCTYSVVCTSSVGGMCVVGLGRSVGQFSLAMGEAQYE